MLLNILENLTNYEAAGAGGAAGGIAGSVAGGLLGALIALGAVVALLAGLAFYIYTSLALMAIAKKLKHKYAWVAWIPIANIGLVLQLGGFHWAWTFLILIPIVGWIALYVMGIIAFWRIFIKVGRPGWWSLSVLIDLVAQGVGTIVFLVLLGIAAWKKKGRK